MGTNQTKTTMISGLAMAIALMALFIPVRSPAASLIPDPVTFGRLRLVIDEPGIREMLDYCDIPGMEVALINDGCISYTGNFGVRNADTGEPVNGDTVFAAASLGKPLFAYIVLRLADRGELGLDQPLCRILGHRNECRDRRYAWITPRMILSHTSGIAHSTLGSMGLESTPGTVFCYSPPAITYLQRVVEEVTGMSLERLAVREVFDPLGMRHSSFHYRDEFGENIVCGHGLNGTAGDLHSYDPSGQDAAWTLLTTAADYARFMVAVAEGEGLSADARDQMLTPHVRVQTGNAGQPVEGVYWGLGWGLQVGAGGTAFWHWGDIGKFTNYAIYYPATGRGLVYLTNSDAGLSIGREMASLITEDYNGLEMLAVEDYADPGWAGRRDRMRRYLAGDIEAGRGLCYTEGECNV